MGTLQIDPLLTFHSLHWTTARCYFSFAKCKRRQEQEKKEKTLLGRHPEMILEESELINSKASDLAHLLSDFISWWGIRSDILYDGSKSLHHPLMLSGKQQLSFKLYGIMMYLVYLHCGPTQQHLIVSELIVGILFMINAITSTIVGIFEHLI